MEELDIWLQAEVKVQARRPAVPKERRRLTANQVKLHIQEIAIQLRKALIPKEMARKALIQEVLVREVHLQGIQEAIHRSSFNSFSVYNYPPAQ